MNPTMSQAHQVRVIGCIGMLKRLYHAAETARQALATFAGNGIDRSACQ